MEVVAVVSLVLSVVSVYSQREFKHHRLASNLKSLRKEEKPALHVMTVNIECTCINCCFSSQL